MDDLFLVIRTNKYTGNFERELMAYVFGIYDEEDEDDVYAEEELKLFNKAMDEDFDYIDEVGDNYDCSRFGRSYSEYYGWYIDKYPGSNECDSIYISIRKRFTDETCKKIKDRLNEFTKREKDLEILSVEYFRSMMVKV